MTFKDILGDNDYEATIADMKDATGVETISPFYSASESGEEGIGTSNFRIILTLE